MEIYEIAVKGRSCVTNAVKQGKYFREWNTDINKICPSLWLQSECEVLPPIKEEFLPVDTEVYTSHGNFGIIVVRQHQKENGTLYPAQVAVYNNMLHLKGIFPIWENQLVKAVK